MTVVTPGLSEFLGTVQPGPGARMGTRCTVLQLPGEQVMVISPVEFSASDVHEIERLGTVTHLVAPNLFHHLFLEAAIRHWPRAAVWGPQGLSKKRPKISVDRLLQAEPDPAWPDEVRCLPIAGMPSFREWAFFHAPSKTLLLTDLIFNHPDAQTALASFFFRLTGTHDRCAVSRLFRTLIRDREAFANSCQALFGWPFERITMAHGKVIEKDARQALAEALSRWIPAAFRTDFPADTSAHARIETDG